MRKNIEYQTEKKKYFSPTYLDLRQPSMARQKTSTYEKTYRLDPSAQVAVPRRKRGKKLKSSSASIEDVFNVESQEMEDDTPKAFARMMKFQQERKNRSLDAETSNSKVEKKTVKKVKNDKTSNAASNLKIEQGESLFDFNKRVNEALPLIKAKGGEIKRGQLKKMKAKEKAEKQRQEELQKRRDRGEFSDNDDDENDRDREARKSGKKRDVSPDPWAALEAKRTKPKFGDVVDAPPDLRLPKKLLKNVPKSAGSMARRAMLEDERDRVINSYRRLKEEKVKKDYDDK